MIIYCLILELQFCYMYCITETKSSWYYQNDRRLNNVTHISPFFPLIIQYICAGMTWSRISLNTINHDNYPITDSMLNICILTRWRSFATGSRKTIANRTISSLDKTLTEKRECKRQRLIRETHKTLRETWQKETVYQNLMKKINTYSTI